MSEQGPPQQSRSRGNNYDIQYRPVVDPSSMYVSIGKVASIVITILFAALYLRDFQHETQQYQRSMTDKMDAMVRAMEGMTTSRDLSDFCMMAQAENSNWKCPAVFQWRRQGSVAPKQDKPVRVMLGSR
jgi:hypothetical protein